MGMGEVDDSSFKKCFSYNASILNRNNTKKINNFCLIDEEDKYE